MNITRQLPIAKVVHLARCLAALVGGEIVYTGGGKTMGIVWVLAGAD